MILSNITNRLCSLSLQIFAEGGDGAGADGTTGVTSAAAGQNAGVNADAAGQDISAKFEELIKGEYKEAFNSRVQDILGKRLKGLEAKTRAYDEHEPLLREIYKQKGIEYGDTKALKRSVYEDRAFEHGRDVDEEIRIEEMEAENRRLREAENIRALAAQADEAMKVYPEFDFAEAMTDPDFQRDIKNGMSVKRAYERTEKFLNSTLSNQVRSVEQKISSSVAANQRRPSEGAMSKSGAVTISSDPKNMSYKQMDEINRRVARGEKIRF